MICDNCLTAAYDEGADTIWSQRDLCRSMGADIPDHICITTEHPSTLCGCACQYQYGPPVLLGGDGLAYVD